VSLWTNVCLGALALVSAALLVAVDGCHNHPSSECSPAEITLDDGGTGRGVFCCHAVGGFQQCEPLLCPDPRTEP